MANSHNIRFLSLSQHNTANQANQTETVNAPPEDRTESVNAVALSASGRYLLVGMEDSLALYNWELRCIRTHLTKDRPVEHIAVNADMTKIIVATRPGEVLSYPLEITKESAAFGPECVLDTPYKDIYSLGFAENADLVVVGHRGHALSLLRGDGEHVWRKHPDDGNATNAQRWTVTLDADGQQLYIGSADGGKNLIAALDPASGETHSYRYEQGLVTGLAALAGGGVVATINAGPWDHRLIVLAPDVATLLWEETFDEHITAVAADRAHRRFVVAVGASGSVRFYDAQGDKPQLLVDPPQALNCVVDHLAIVRGSDIAATLHDEQRIALLTSGAGGQV